MNSLSDLGIALIVNDPLTGLFADRSCYEMRNQSAQMCAGWPRRSDVVNGPVVERIELPVRTLASVEAMAERVGDDPQFRRALVSLLIT